MSLDDEPIPPPPCAWRELIHEVGLTFEEKQKRVQELSKAGAFGLEWDEDVDPINNEPRYEITGVIWRCRNTRTRRAKPTSD